MKLVRLDNYAMECRMLSYEGYNTCSLPLPGVQGYATLGGWN